MRNEGCSDDDASAGSGRPLDRAAALGGGIPARRDLAGGWRASSVRLVSDVHVHVPAGAIPMDGPAAGITMTVAVASLLTRQRIPAKREELDLGGDLLPVDRVSEAIEHCLEGGSRGLVSVR